MRKEEENFRISYSVLLVKITVTSHQFFYVMLCTVVQASLTAPLKLPKMLDAIVA